MEEYDFKRLKNHVKKVLGLKQISYRDMALIKRLCGLKPSDEFSAKIDRKKYLIFKAYIHVKKGSAAPTPANVLKVVTKFKADPSLINRYDKTFDDLPDIVTVEEMLGIIHQHLGKKPAINTLRGWFKACGMTLEINRRYSSIHLYKILEYKTNE